MVAEAVRALVVRGTDWSETSRIVTLFTRELGKIRALAKGGRRLQSTFEIALDLLTVCDVMVIRKGQGGLDLLTEARVVERFPQLRADMRCLYAGYYVAELLADGTQDYDPHPDLFESAVHFLHALTPGQDRDTLNLQRVAFELVWLQELGYRPRLDACAACGAVMSPAQDGQRIGYSPSAGGVVCPRCFRTVHDLRMLGSATWQCLREFLNGAYQQEIPAGIPGAVQAELRLVLGQAVSFVLGRRPKLLTYLDGP